MNKLFAGLAVIAGILGSPMALPAVLAAAPMVAAGAFHGCTLTSAGAVKCWGYNREGELGDGTTTNATTPVAVAGLSSGVVAVAAGGSHTCALTKAGAVLCWGYNGGGELGNGGDINATTPVAVAGLSSGVAAIAAGGSHTCALTGAGAVLCWGLNAHGELGNGTTVSTTTPTAVSGLTSGIRAIAAGAYHTCALTSAGAVKCWGNNVYGALGNGAATGHSMTPVAVTGLTDGVVAITAGYEDTCALTGTGAVMCWGYNYEGELGDGSTTNASTPVAVTGLSGGVVGIAAGAAHTCAVTSAGMVQCWGYNNAGQLGNGTTINATTPVAVTGLSSGMVAIAAGQSYTCALTGAGAVKCWGFNGYGALGNGTTTSSTTPVAVTGLNVYEVALTNDFFAVSSLPMGAATFTVSVAATPSMVRLSV